jgi:hypothetical protein
VRSLTLEVRFSTLPVRTRRLTQQFSTLTSHSASQAMHLTGLTIHSAKLPVRTKKGRVRATGRTGRFLCQTDHTKSRRNEKMGRLVHSARQTDHTAGQLGRFVGQTGHSARRTGEFDLEAATDKWKRRAEADNTESGLHEKGHPLGDSKLSVAPRSKDLLRETRLHSRVQGKFGCGLEKKRRGLQVTKNSLLRFNISIDA